MANTLVTPAATPENIVPLTPGETTSEFTATKWSIILSVIAFSLGIVADVLAQVSTAFPSLTWIGPILNVVGVIGTMLAALGYNKGRVLLKSSPYVGPMK